MALLYQCVSINTKKGGGCVDNFLLELERWEYTKDILIF